MQWANMKTSDDQTSPVLTMILSGKTLFFYNVNNPDAPMELAFQPNYGHIVTYHWFGDGFVLLGFTSGYVVVISTNISEMGQELFQTRDHRDALTDIAVSPILNKAATCGDNSIKIHDLADMKDTYAIITLDDDRGQLDKLQWSDDGQFLSVGTKEPGKDEEFDSLAAR
ncbi:WD repeat-containing protein 19 [Borealophlyctis nickersoniae]|nr:WD repeat-containing protein 19 [Borealophlyctis nickersoniae]